MTRRSTLSPVVAMQLLIVISILFAAPSISEAQFAAEVQPGTRVRVWIPETIRQEQPPENTQLLRGTVESVNGATLHLGVPGTGGSLAIPRTSISRLDVSQGVSRGASMFERAAGGAIGTAIVFAILNDPKRTRGLHYRTGWQAAGVGAAWGCSIGAIVGFAWPYERWDRVIH